MTHKVDLKKKLRIEFQENILKSLKTLRKNCFVGKLFQDIAGWRGIN